MAVATFAKNRMAERYPSTKDGQTPILPTDEVKPMSQPDLLSKFMQAKIDRPEFMTDSLVTTMAVSMAFAGSETTAISLASVFYYLLKNPSTLRKLYSELDDRASRGFFADSEHGLVTWAESQDLPFLDACIKEAFRLHPAPGLPLERIVPPGGTTIAGEFIKGGTIVGCSAWVLHRRPEIFGEDVEVFRPERWLVGQGDESWKEASKEEREKEEKRIKEMGATMLQFGMGARTCIGKNISLLEIYKLVPTFLRRFEVFSPLFFSRLPPLSLVLGGKEDINNHRLNSNTPTSNGRSIMLGLCDS
jgi:cytochrome P450